jgi:hypothetical protein
MYNFNDVETFVEDNKCGVRHSHVQIGENRTIVIGISPEQAAHVAQAIRDAFREGQRVGAIQVSNAARKAAVDLNG